MNSKKKPEDNDLGELIKSAKLLGTGVRILKLAQRLHSKLSPAVQFFLALIGLFIAIWFGSNLGSRLLNNQRNVARTLPTELVSTAYPHRGVTAFLTADLEKTLPSDKVYTQDLKDAIRDIETALNASVANLQKTFNPDEVLKLVKPTVNNMNSGSERGPDPHSAWTKAVTSTQIDGGFLMVPAISLRQPIVGDYSLNDENLESVLKYNQEVLFDFHVATVVAPIIDEKFNGPNELTVKSLKIVQAYFISESGVIFLRALPTSMSYSDTFPRYTLFMDRLYFWGAVDPRYKQKEDKDSPFDYRTNPYIDLGGNGVVKTYSKKVLLPNHRVGVICLDVALPSSSVEELKQRLRALGATKVEDASWTTGSWEPVSKEMDPLNGFKWVDRVLHSKPQEQSRILGAIAFESDYRDPGDADDGTIRFTVPVGSRNAGEGKSTTTLLLVSFDFSAINWIIIKDSIGFLVGISLLVIFTWNLFFDYNRLTAELNKVLENMSEVMYDAATPFAWLNDKNEFVKVNVSFLKVVGCKNDTALKKHASKFRDLITVESQPVYDAKLTESASGEKTPKYEIDIIKENGEEIHVLVHGERIPYPSFWRRGRPHRFGVFLPQPPETEGKQQRTKQPQRKV